MLAVTDGHHVGSHLLHGVVDRQPGRDGSARGVDVDLDVLLGIFRFQEQELGHQGVGHLIVDAGAQEDDPLPQEAGIDVEGPLAAPRLLHHGGQHAWRGLPAVVDRMGAKGFDHAAGAGETVQVFNLWRPQAWSSAPGAGSAASGAFSVRVLLASSHSSRLSRRRSSATASRSRSGSIELVSLSP
jgi:hypothetical protein